MKIRTNFKGHHRVGDGIAGFGKITGSVGGNAGRKKMSDICRKLPGYEMSWAERSKAGYAFKVKKSYDTQCGMDGDGI